MYDPCDIPAEAHEDAESKTPSERRGRKELPRHLSFSEESRLEDDEERRYQSEVTDKIRRGASFVPEEEIPDQNFCGESDETWREVFDSKKEILPPFSPKLQRSVDVMTKREGARRAAQARIERMVPVIEDGVTRMVLLDEHLEGRRHEHGSKYHLLVSKKYGCRSQDLRRDPSIARLLRRAG